MSIRSRVRELVQRGVREEYRGHAVSVHSCRVPTTGDPTGAEGGDASPAADRPPALPAHDGAPLGDTDQHSQAYRLRE